jgi:hypothetical protein
MTVTYEGPMCGSWEGALERIRGIVDRLPVRMRDDVLRLIADQEEVIAIRWVAVPPTPKDVDEAIRGLDCMVPVPLEEIGDGVSMTFGAVGDDISVLVAELLDLRDRVAVLECAGLNTPI